jgi:hypothetical protein
VPGIAASRHTPRFLRTRFLMMMGQPKNLIRFSKYATLSSVDYV